MSIKLKPFELAQELNNRAAQIKREMGRAIDSAANASRRIVREATPSDLGDLKKSWAVARGKGKVRAILINDAPHAGIVEEGARPHHVSQDGIERLIEWARRKVTSDPDEAKRIAYGIANKIKKRGQPGTFFVRALLPAMNRSVVIKFEQRLRKISKNRAR